MILPDKISVVFDKATQNRINCMPSALLKDNLYGVKWVAVFPENPKSNYRNVTGTIILLPDLAVISTNISKVSP